MNESNYLCMIVAYYLSKYDDNAYEALGFGNKSETHRHIGRILGVNKNTVKNMRDEFDPLHENNRTGWDQRELRPSRLQIISKYHSLKEEELRDISIEILENQNTFLEFIEDEIIGDNLNINDATFIFRGIADSKAEELLFKLHETKNLPLAGELHDKRGLNLGYDFQIIGEQIIYIKVKGLGERFGGVSFSSKEINFSKKEGEKYYLIIIKNVFENPSFEIIQNPFKKLNPKKNLYKVLQIKWNIHIA